MTSPMTRENGSLASRGAEPSNHVQRLSRHSTPMSSNKTPSQERTGLSGAELIDHLKYKTSSTPPEEKNRCPECKSVDIHRRTRRYKLADGTPAYHCEYCDHRFDQPARFALAEIPEAMRR